MRDLDTHIWKEWTIRDFIEDSEMIIDRIMKGQSFKPPFKSKDELSKFLRENYPYTKSDTPEVTHHFATKYNLK